MKFRSLCTLLCTLYVGTLYAARVENLRCEYLTDPEGIDIGSPRLSWVVTSSLRGDHQSAYRILVASTPERLSRGEADLWDSGLKHSDHTIHIRYEGRPLQAFDRCYWRVQVCDAKGHATWSPVAHWSMGPLSATDWGSACWIAPHDESQWQAQWQTHKEQEMAQKESTWPWFNGMGRSIWAIRDMASPHYEASPLLRHEFTTAGRVARATLYVCGVGYYEAYLNGERIGDHVLDPAWTNYDQRSLYATYDVTRSIREGSNAIGLMLGHGQYNPLCNDIWGLYRSRWVGQPKAIALMRIEYRNGTTATVVTDPSWRWTGGPITYDDTRKGEIYDARLESEGWNTSGYDCSSWQSAVEVPAAGPLRAQMLPPIRCFAPIAPLRTYHKADGRTIYDLGVNLSGWARVRVKGPSGAKVLVEYCELPGDREVVPDIHPSKLQIPVVDSDYASFYDCGVKVRQQNGYILKGASTGESFACHFSYKGFQYIRITVDHGVQIERVEGIPVHTDLTTAGAFRCSDSTVNRLQQIARRTLLNNYHGIPTDCPHREKQGWTADAYMTSSTAIYNYDMAAFYTKWLTDLAGTQDASGGMCTVAPSTGYDQSISTVWPAALLFIARDMQHYYGDQLTAQRLLPAMRRFVSGCRKRQIEGRPYILHEVLGDWVSPHMTLSPQLESFDMAPPEGLSLYGTASYYRAARFLSQIERSLGNTLEADTTAQLAERIAAAFNRTYLDPQTHTYHGDNPTPYRQAANVVPLQYGITPEDEQSDVSAALYRSLDQSSDRIATGFVGTMALMEYLPQSDPERAFRVATQPDYPGWGYMVRHGATTMWETWDGACSRNHPPFCLISAYFYRYLAGIRCDDGTGFKQFTIDPSVVGSLTYVDAWHDTMYGRIISSWTHRNGLFTLHVSIPVGTTATVCIPADSNTVVTESGSPANHTKGLTVLGTQGSKQLFKVVSGHYTFRSTLHEPNP